MKIFFMFIFYDCLKHFAEKALNLFQIGIIAAFTFKNGNLKS